MTTKKNRLRQTFDEVQVILDRAFVVPDWDENDPKSGAYIRNRTHWTESGSFPATLEWEWDGEDEKSLVFYLKAGNTSIAMRYSGPDSWKSDGGIWGVYWDGDRLFLLDTALKTMYHLDGFAPDRTGMPIDLGFSLDGTAVHKLDSKYLDTDQVPTEGSDKPITSGGMATVLKDVIDDLATIRGALAAKGNAKIFAGVCETAAGTADKIVGCPSFLSADLVPGALVAVRFTAKNTASVAALTMDVNGTGAYPLRKRNNAGYSTLAATGELDAGHTLFFTFTGTYWCAANMDYNTMYTQDKIYRYQGKYVASSAVYRYQMLFQVDEDTLTPLNNVSNGYARIDKPMLTDVGFDPFGLIHFFPTTSGDTPEGGYIPATYLALCHGAADLRYTFNMSAKVNPLTPDKSVYIKVLIGSDGKARIATGFPLVQTLPSEADGYHYIFLGRACGAYQMSIYPDHPVFFHDGERIRELWRQTRDCVVLGDVVEDNVTIVTT